MATKVTAKSEIRVTASEEAEQAVKAYLATLGNPKPRGRQARPKPDFETATKGITDPLAKLAAIKAERERVANIVIGDDAEDGFVKYGKVWAKINGYGREDFAALGVSRRVLEAVFGAGGSGAPRATTASKRAARVSVKDLADAIAAKAPGTWLTVNEVMREAGGSPATVRKVLDELAAAGTVTDPIDDPKHSGKGRAPKVWERN
ncbi:MAG TPA: hypothetical protein VGP92_16260 [Acidimicrobiia bacterium]|jgi:hypothetical protein|nr:hypothetical protein [Acidimicrobiia bacterium]